MPRLRRRHAVQLADKGALPSADHTHPEFGHYYSPDRAPESPSFLHFLTAESLIISDGMQTLT